MVAALAVEAVSHTYGRSQALDDVSFAIPPGRFTVLLGLNGAGKTTLFSLISRLYATQKGAIRIFGHEIGRSPREALRRLGIVFQARTLDLDLTVRQNLAYHASLHGIGAGAARQRIASVLETVEMSDRLGDKTRSLSGGQMRRVEIARALLHEPRLMLLDEPTVGLDIQSRAAILAFIRRLVNRDGISVLWATHLIDEVEQGDDVVVLSAGKVTAKGPVADVVKATGTADIAGAFSHLCRAGFQREEHSP
ncbi:ABC transporter ATP-binding protein [Nitratireductor sp. GCM10026969]|uniref:ABC transporter ATP-binding protein n=1 Tax=Nitratireductor sp. GCM10026969 TaxID=3252645 RepID=UPI00360D40AD